MRPILPLLIAISMVGSAQAASLAGGPSAAASVGPLQIPLGQAARIALSRPADSIIIGSDEVINAVPVGNSRTVAITARKPGVTNLLVLDAAGGVILNRQVQVAASGAGSVSVISGGGGVTNYACSPSCAVVDSTAGAVSSGTGGMSMTAPTVSSNADAVGPTVLKPGLGRVVYRAAMSFGFTLSKFLRRYSRARHGATAVEFALVALPFFMLLFGVLQLGMVMLISSTMDGALFQTARLIRTGQVTNASTPAAVKTSLCTEMSWLGSSCNSGINIDVRTFPSFAAVSAPNPANGATPSKMCWDTGGPGSVVLVTAYYPWDLWTPLLDSSLVNLGTTRHLIVSRAVFRNEPFAGAAAAPKGCPS